MEDNVIQTKRVNRKPYVVYFLFVTILFYTLIRIVIVNCYTIATSSMAPTIQPGEKVHSVKLLFGFKKIEPNDIVVFKKPQEKNGVETYCKRVLGCPGDRIGAVDGHCWNDKVLRPIGVVEEQEKLRWMFDGFFKMTNSFDVIPFTNTDWNIKNWGPIVVPAKGLTMVLDDITRELYRQVIEYETGNQLVESITEYTFQRDYYFAVGDNAISSFDSRYWGFIPEDYIIGIVGGKK